MDDFSISGFDFIWIKKDAGGEKKNVPHKKRAGKVNPEPEKKIRIQ